MNTSKDNTHVLTLTDWHLEPARKGSNIVKNFEFLKIEEILEGLSIFLDWDVPR